MRLAAALVFVALTSPAFAADKSARKRTCRILDAGTYRPLKSLPSVPDPTSPTGSRGATLEVEFLSQTRTIARVRGASFGIRYRIAVPGTVTTVITFPRPLNGKSRWVSDESSSSGGLVAHIGYIFSQDFEMEPGPWLFEVRVDARTVCAVTFTVK